MFWVSLRHPQLFVFHLWPSGDLGLPFKQLSADVCLKLYSLSTVYLLCWWENAVTSSENFCKKGFQEHVLVKHCSTTRGLGKIFFSGARVGVGRHLLGLRGEGGGRQENSHSALCMPCQKVSYIFKSTASTTAQYQNFTGVPTMTKFPPSWSLP